MYSFRPVRFADHAAAYAFAKANCGTCRHPGEKNRRPSWNRSARSLLAMQAAMDAGDYRVSVEHDPDVDTSWDDSGEVAAKLASDDYVSVCVVLERLDTWMNARTGETEERWTVAGSCSGIIGPDGDPYWQDVACDLFDEDRRTIEKRRA